MSFTEAFKMGWLGGIVWADFMLPRNLAVRVISLAVVGPLALVTGALFAFFGGHA